jgi:hypothetical protein
MNIEHSGGEANVMSGESQGNCPHKFIYRHIHRWDSKAPCDIEMKPRICEDAKSESGIIRLICVVTVHMCVFVRMLS